MGYTNNFERGILLLDAARSILAAVATYAALRRDSDIEGTAGFYEIVSVHLVWDRQYILMTGHHCTAKSFVIALYKSCPVSAVGSWQRPKQNHTKRSHALCNYLPLIS